MTVSLKGILSLLWLFPSTPGEGEGGSLLLHRLTSFRALFLEPTDIFELEVLKGLSHEIETGCRWCGCKNLYLEMYRLVFITGIYLVAPSIFNLNSSSPSGLAKASG
jgi:hypothetical protein